MKEKIQKLLDLTLEEYNDIDGRINLYDNQGDIAPNYLFEEQERLETEIQLLHRILREWDEL